MIFNVWIASTDRSDLKLKVSKKELKAMIIEEYKNLLNELNPYHDKKTGKLSGPQAGNSYSLSKPAVKKAGIKDEFAKKGEVTGKGNVRKEDTEEI